MAPTQAQPALRLPGLCLRTSPGPRSLAHRGRDGGEQPVAPQGGREPSSEYSSPGPGQAFVGDEEYNLNASCLRPLPEVRTDSPASLCESRRPTFCVLPSSARRLPAPLRALGPQREAWGNGPESLGVLRQQQGAGGGGEAGRKNQNRQRGAPGLATQAPGACEVPRFRSLGLHPPPAAPLQLLSHRSPGLSAPRGFFAITSKEHVWMFAAVPTDVEFTVPTL